MIGRVLWLVCSVVSSQYIVDWERLHSVSTVYVNWNSCCYVAAKATYSFASWQNRLFGVFSALAP